MGPVSFLLAGAGGQGTLLASSILAEVGLRAGDGAEVKRSKVHGMAQRGGSVSSHVQWGKRVASPLIGAGEADILIALERAEALRYLDMLRPGGRALVSDYAIVSVMVTAGRATYPSREDTIAALRQVTSEIALIPAVRIAESLGNARVNNVVALGALSRWLDVSERIWQDVISERVPAKYRDLNLAAFARGRELVSR